MNSKNKIIILTILVILILIKGYLFSVKYESDEKQKEYTVFVESIKSYSDTKVSYNVKLLNSNDKFILNIYENSYDSIQTDLSQYSKYQYGNVIKIKGKISVPKLLKNPGEFNYRQYLYSNNIYGLINTYDVPQQVEYNLNLVEKIYSKVYEFKSYIQSNIFDSMENVNANVAISMIYGNTLNLDEQIQEGFENLGVSHLMSVSGTHITSFMLIVNLLLGNIKSGKKRKIKNRQKQKKVMNKIKGSIQILSILLYIVFTGFGISVLRAGIMIIVSIVCDMFEVKKNKYIALGISFLLILVHTPFVIFNTGFQLSFLATLGIIVFAKYISQTLSKLTDKINNECIKKVVKYILDSISITIAVQLLIIPVQIQSFNKLYFPMIISNLILGIISIPIRVIGTIGIMFSFVSNISCGIFKIVEWFVIVLIEVSEFLNLFSLNITTASQLLMFFVIYYLALLLMFMYLKLRKVTKYKEGRYSFKKLLKYLKLIVVCLIMLSIVIVIWVNIYLSYYSEFVYFFNVEQGEMSYVKSGKSSIIVDIGSMKKGLGFNTISNFFKEYNLNKVDAIVLSHMHSDHINGLEEFLKQYNIEKIIYAKPKTLDENYNNFIKVVGEYGIDTLEVKQGDKFKFGNIIIEVLLPDNEYIKEDEANENSLICRVTVENKSILYMGDASENAEQKLLNENVDLSNIYILKVGHHGSKTATTEEFIQKTNPKYAVISASKKYYGHPHENTLQTLDLYNVHTYLTELHGAIKFDL